MTKQDVKDLCEDDPQLQWWAMILFAEIVEVVDGSYRQDDEMIARHVRIKVAEFPRLIIQRAQERAKERANAKSE